MEQQKFSAQMQDEMIADSTTAHPKYVAYVGIQISWLARNPVEKILKWSRAYLRTCYDVVGGADIASDRPTVYVWDKEATGYSPESSSVVATFKARADAPCSASQY